MLEPIPRKKPAGGACAASPFIKVAGALVLVGSIIYLITKYFT